MRTELFHPDHGSQERHCVMLQPFEPTNQIAGFLHDPTYSHLMRYLKGNVMNSKDLERCAIHAAEAVIILTNKNSGDPVSMDHKNILQGLAMKKYVQE